MARRAALAVRSPGFSLSLVRCPGFSLFLVCSAGFSLHAAPLPWTPDLSDISSWEQIDSGVEGDWSARGGLVYQDSQEQGVSGESAWTALVAEQSFEAMTLRAAVRTYGEGTGDTVGLVFGWQDVANAWRVRLRRPWSGGPAWRVLERVVGGAVETLVSAEGMADVDVVELSVVVDGNAVQVFEEERGIMLLTELADPPAGRVGLLTTGAGRFSFRRVAVEEPRSIRPQIVMGPWISDIAPDRAVVSWVFDRPMRAQVWIGPEASEYYPLDLPELAGEPRHHWCVTIPGLSPGRRYLGRVMYEAPTIDGTMGWDVAGNFSFRAAPADGSATFRVGICSDNQVNSPAHWQVSAALAEESPDLVVNVGDLVTAGRSAREWRTEFFEPSAALLARAPVFVAIGNHEQDADTFYDLFAHPGRRDWYAVTYGSMRLVVLDTNQQVRPGSPQMDWLRGEIESEAFRRATWRVAAFHHPPFCQGWDNPDYDGAPSVREHLWPVLRDAGFDLLLSGHAHNYERGELDGVTLVVTGGGGGALDHFEQRWPFFSVYEAADQYCIADISPERLAFQAKTPEGRVIDQFTLSR